MCIKVGILGCGMIGQSFMKQSEIHPGFEVVALYSRSADTLDEAALLKPNAKKYLQKEDFFCDKEVEAVIICTPHSEHTSDALLALQAGKHTLIEKPIATSQSELEDLVEASIRYPSLVITALPHGSNEFIIVARELISLDFIGKVTAIHSYLDVPGPLRSNWYYSKLAVGGASLDTLPYALARIFSVFQVDVREVCGLKNQLITHRLCGDGGKVKAEVDDSAALTLIFSTGQYAIARSTWNVSKVEDFLVIQGRRGEIQIDAWRNIINLKSEKKVSDPRVIVANDTQKLELKTTQPEYLKLKVFEDHLNKKTGNLQEVCYFMRMIFSQLFDQSTKIAQQKFYCKNQVMKNLQMGDNYI